MEELGRAIMLDEDKIFLKLHRHFLETKGYSIFTTDNPYKLLLYGREIMPEIIFMDINLPRRNNWEFLEKISLENWMRDIPVILMSPEYLPADRKMPPVANIFNKKTAIEKVFELLETYCRGGQNHDIFVLADYAPELEQELSGIKNRHHNSCFVAHDLKGSRKYLAKNKPRKIAVRYSPERFNKIKGQLPPDNVFRIDSIPEIEKLAEDIK